MELSIQKWGNSAAVRLPATLSSQLGVSLGGGDFARYAGFAVPLGGPGTETQGVDW